MTTKTLILSIAPDLSAMTDDQFAQAIVDAAVLVTLPGCPSKIELAQRYLAAHLLEIARPQDSGGSNSSGSALTGEKAGRESRNYGSAPKTASATDYSSTKYGVMYMSIVKSCASTLTAIVV